MKTVMQCVIVSASTNRLVVRSLHTTGCICVTSFPLCVHGCSPYSMFFTSHHNAPTSLMGGGLRGGPYAARYEDQAALLEAASRAALLQQRHAQVSRRPELVFKHLDQGHVAWVTNLHRGDALVVPCCPFLPFSARCLTRPFLPVRQAMGQPFVLSPSSLSMSQQGQRTGLHSGESSSEDLTALDALLLGHGGRVFVSSTPSPLPNFHDPPLAAGEHIHTDTGTSKSGHSSGSHAVASSRYPFWSI